MTGTCLCTKFDPAGIDPTLLEMALTWRSARQDGEVDSGDGWHNQRLEFLGDSVLGFVVSLYLFASSGDAATECDLTEARASIISNSNISHACMRAGLPPYFYIRPFSSSASLTDLRQQSASPKMLADAFEALIGCLYLSNTAARNQLECIHPETPSGQGRDRLAAGNPAHSFAACIAAASLVDKHGFSPMNAKTNNKIVHTMLSTFKIFSLATAQETPLSLLFSELDLEIFVSRGLRDFVLNSSDFDDSQLLGKASNHAISDMWMGQPSKEIEQGGMELQLRPHLVAAARSLTRTLGRWLSYELLEYLGDSTIQLLVVDWLHARFPHAREGALTFIKSVLLSNAYFASKLMRRLNAAGIVYDSLFLEDIQVELPKEDCCCLRRDGAQRSTSHGAMGGLAQLWTAAEAAGCGVRATCCCVCRRCLSVKADMLAEAITATHPGDDYLRAEAALRNAANTKRSQAPSPLALPTFLKRLGDVYESLVCVSLFSFGFDFKALWGVVSADFELSLPYIEETLRRDPKRSTPS